MYDIKYQNKLPLCEHLCNFPAWDFLVALKSLCTIAAAAKQMIIKVIFVYDKSVENIFAHLAALFTNRFSL